MKIGSLFSGIGGLDLAVEAFTGGSVAWHAEVDPYACTVLGQHWPGTPNLGNVAHITNPPPVEVICGGFPCQDISSAGKREGLDGKKSGLWREMARLVCRVRPRLVFVENVSTLVARGLDDVLGDLAGLGFDAEWACVRAADVGAPHRRNRMFILAYRDLESLRELSERFEQRSPKCEDMADAVHNRRGSGSGSETHHEDWSDACWNDAHGRDEGLVFPPKPDDGDGWVAWTEGGGAQPGVHRGAYGAPKGVDAWVRRERLRCLGNAVVPRQAMMAFAGLARRAVR